MALRGLEGLLAFWQGATWRLGEIGFPFQSEQKWGGRAACSNLLGGKSERACKMSIRL